jgi:hypothetical protein
MLFSHSSGGWLQAGIWNFHQPPTNRYNKQFGGVSTIPDLPLANNGVPL